MGQMLHSCAKKTEATRRAIQNSQESLRTLSGKYGVNLKTVDKWKKHTTVSDAPMGPKTVKSTVLTTEEEAVIVAFRNILCYHWMIAYTPYKNLFITSLVHHCTDACNGMESVGCRK